MKVLTISTVELAKNGITTCILNYHKKFDDSEVSIDIIAPNVINEFLKNDLVNKGGQLYEITMRKTSTLKYFIKLVKIIKQNKYDIVHAHGNSCTLVVEMVAALLGGCKIRIAHSHNTSCEHMRVHRFFKPLFDLTYTDGVACGEDAGKWLFGNNKFTVIKNGVDIHKYKFKEDVRSKYRDKLCVKDEVLLGHVGLFNYQKNHEFLINVFELLVKNDKNSKYKLLLIGDGDLRVEIEKRVLQKGIVDKVIFIGNVDNVPDYLQAIDIFVLPSRFEGLPYVLVEAQAVGLPCFVSNNVSKEAEISDRIEFLPIENEYNIWIEKIYQMSKLLDKIDRKNAHEAIIKNGFNIDENAEMLRRMYYQMIDNLE